MIDNLKISPEKAKELLNELYDLEGKLRDDINKAKSNKDKL